MNFNSSLLGMDPTIANANSGWPFSLFRNMFQGLLMMFRDLLEMWMLNPLAKKKKKNMHDSEHSKWWFAFMKEEPGKVAVVYSDC